MKNEVGALCGFVIGVAVAGLAAWLFLYSPPENITVREPLRERSDSGKGVEYQERKPSSLPGQARDSTGRGGDRPGTGSSSPGEGDTQDSAKGAKEEPAFLRGAVLFGKDREPLPNILLVFSRGGKSFLQCFTGQRGRFNVGLPGGGLWRVTSIPYGEWAYCPWAEASIENGGNASIDVVVPDRGICSVTGRVTLEGGEGIGGVHVTITAGVEGRGAEEKAGVTSSDGRYEFKGVAVPFPKPAEQTAGSVDDFSFYRSIAVRSDDAPRPFVSLTFTHPDYPKASKMEALQSPEDTIRCDVTLRPVGKITGTVQAPEGTDLDGKSLPYRFVKGKKTRWESVTIEGDRFTIRIGYPTKEDRFFRRAGIPMDGRLILGGLVGRLWLEDVDLGVVDRKTRLKDVVLKPQVVPVHFVHLLDRDGNPVLEGPDLHAWVKIGASRSISLEIESARVVLPVFFKKSTSLHVDGIDFPRVEIEISPEVLPPSVTLESLPLLMRGKITFPAQFDDWEEVSISYVVEGPDLRLASIQEGLHFDRETGEFRLKRPFDAKDRKNSANPVTYTVTISIPGFKPWVKRNLNLKDDETIEDVVVTFEK